MKLTWMRRIFIGFLVGASLFAAVNNLASTAELGSLQRDPVADWERRFVVLRAKLPFTRGVIGYISDSDVPGASFDAANDEGEYILTQYALAPIILVRGTGQEWNLANLTRASFDLWRTLHPTGFELVWEHGGLYLLRRAAS